MKVLYRPSTLHDPWLAPRFHREILATTSLYHPNVVNAEEVFEDDEFIAFTMPYVKGGTLADRLEAGKMRVVQVYEILSQIALGLEAIHERGFIHRDLKPSNILCSASGHVRIADFGLTINDLRQSEGKDNVVGSINYVSPEYVATGEFDHRTDIFALGVIGYEMITGLLPFAHADVVQSLMQRLTRRPKSPAALNSECPIELSRLLMKCLHPRPDARFQSATEMVEQLEEQRRKIFRTEALSLESREDIRSFARERFENQPVEA